jgi:hypothetical protein
MKTELWVSTAARPDRSELGTDWQRIGTLNGPREYDLWRIVEAYLGLRPAGLDSFISFYADADPKSPWYQELVSSYPSVAHGKGLANLDARFWIALRWMVEPVPRILFATKPARLANPKRSVPPTTRSTVPLGIALRAAPQGFFEVVAELRV